MRVTWKPFTPVSVVLFLARIPPPERLAPHDRHDFADFSGIIAGFVVRPRSETGQWRAREKSCGMLLRMPEPCRLTIWRALKLQVVFNWLHG